MLPFFRKIRYQLARDNQFFKYGRYAIGEIVLVVIGILIALQINNWNEDQKDQERLIGNLKEMRTDLINDTLNFNDYMDFLIQESQNKKTLLEQDSYEPFSLDSLISLVQPFTTVNDINTKSFYKIDWSAVKREEKLDSLIDAIQRYYMVTKPRHDSNVEWDQDYTLKESEYWYYHPEFELSYLESIDENFPYLQSDEERLQILIKELGTIKVRNLIRMGIYKKEWVKKGIERTKGEATQLLESINAYLERVEDS